MLVVTAIAVLVLTLFPSEAYAWGLVTHLELSRTLLDSAQELLRVSAPCVLQFPFHFFYGSIAPDRFLAKNLNSYEEHTHNWDRVFQMSRAAGTDELKAFSLGYLSHLAADVIAHNHFVPLKIMERPGVTQRRHSYWEMMFEQCQPEEAWELSEWVDRQADKSLLDGFMESFQLPSMLSFGANMAVTDRLFRFLGSDTARRWVSRFEQGSDDAISAEESKVYMDLAMEAIQGLLLEGESAPVTCADPRGGSRITHARLLSKAATHSSARLAARVSRAYGPEMSQLIRDAVSVLLDGAPGQAGSTAYRSLEQRVLTTVPSGRGPRRS